MEKTYEIVLARSQPDEIDRHCYPVPLPHSDDDSPYSTRNSLFHFATWLAGNNVSDFMVSCQLSSAPTQNLHSVKKIVLFGHEKDRDDFTRWSAKLSGWFITRPMSEECIPSMPSAGSYEMHMVPFKVTLPPGEWNEMSSPEMFETWSWITHNCYHPVWRFNDGFAFSNGEDAVKFKLTHG